MIKLFIFILLLFQISCSNNQIFVGSSSRTIASNESIKDLVIYIGAPRGGFGDVASNLLMAKKLQERGIKIKLVVSEGAQASLQTLLPDYNPKVDKSIVNKFEIYSEGPNNWPPGENLASFSTDGYIPEEAKYPKKFSFFEYSAFTNSQLGDDFSLTEKINTFEDFYIVTAIDKNTASNTFLSNTGINQLGAYISENKSEDVLPLEAIAKKYSEVLSANNVNLLASDVKLGFSYTHKIHSTQLYLDGVKEFIRTKNITEKVVIFIKNFENLDIKDLPSNLVVVKLDSIPFEYTRSLIANSNLPIMVTGDVSLTLALDFEKLCFYEMNDWKQHLVKDLITGLYADGTALANDEHSSQLKKFHYQMLSLSSDTPELTVEEMANVFSATNFQKNYSASIAKVRKKYSLPKNFIELIKITELFENKNGNAILASIMRLYFEKDEPTSEGLIEYAHKAINESGRNADYKLRLFYSLLYLKDFNSPTTQNMFVDIVEKADESFWISLRDLFNLNMGKRGEADKFNAIAKSVYASNSEIAKKRISMIIQKLPEARKALLPQALRDLAIKDLEVKRSCHQLLQSFLN